MSGGGPGAVRHRQWVTELDRLELDVIRAERMLEDPGHEGPGAWEPPAALAGPIPADLRQRAADLADRQRQVQSALSTLLAAIARQHEYAARVDRATRASGSAIYLDITA